MVRLQVGAAFRFFSRSFEILHHEVAKKLGSRSWMVFRGCSVLMTLDPLKSPALTESSDVKLSSHPGLTTCRYVQDRNDAVDTVAAVVRKLLHLTFVSQLISRKRSFNPHRPRICPTIRSISSSAVPAPIQNSIPRR